MEHLSADILLVEDNPTDLELSLRALTTNTPKKSIHVARDGVQALNYLFGRGEFIDRDIQYMPKIILLDLKLPKINGLEVSGSFHKNFKQTIILLSPAYNFWPIFKKSDEYHQKIIDPIDTWSKRVISNIAIKVSAEPKFPFGKNFGAPFFEWAKLSGEAWDSPIGMLVHSKMGLMVSYRGALIFDQKIKLRKRYPEKPCIKCIKKPCINACPIDALTPEGYDIQSCYDFLDTNIVLEIKKGKKNTLCKPKTIFYSIIFVLQRHR